MKITAGTTINPAQIINDYAKKFGIPARDIYLHISLDGNDLYSPECETSDWLVNEGIIIDKENNIEMIPMYWERENDYAKIGAIRDSQQ